MSTTIFDKDTGEIIQNTVTIETEKALSVQIDIAEVAVYHDKPKELAEKIRQQTGFVVFDMSNKKGRDQCKSAAANIIRCISPAIEESKKLAEEAKKVAKKDLNFRNVFEEEVRAIAAAVRLPLTEWESEQERIAEELRLAEEKRQAEEQFLKDWQDAIDYDELYTLRLEKQRIEAEKAEAERLAGIAIKKAWAKENADGYQFLFADISDLLTKSFDDFKLVFTARIEKYNLDIAEQRETIRIEEEAKAAAKIKTEQDEAERQRVDAENKKQTNEQLTIAWNKLSSIADEDGLQAEILITGQSDIVLEEIPLYIPPSKSTDWEPKPESEFMGIGANEFILCTAQQWQLTEDEALQLIHWVAKQVSL